MRTYTITRTVYKYDELSDKAKEKALMDLSDMNVDYEWWENVYEDAKNIGVEIDEFGLNRDLYCRGRFCKSELDVADLIIKEHGKDCGMYKDAYEFLWDFAIEEDTARIGLPDEDLEDFDYDPDFCSDLLDEFRRTIFEDYRIILQNEYDYRTSEDTILRAIEENDYEFTADGRIDGGR